MIEPGIYEKTFGVYNEPRHVYVYGTARTRVGQIIPVPPSETYVLMRYVNDSGEPYGDYMLEDIHKFNDEIVYMEEFNTENNVRTIKQYFHKAYIPVK